MARVLSPSIVLVVCLFVGIEAANKYDRNENRARDMDISGLGKEFKSRQITQVWQKAHRMELSRDKLKDLHRELVRLDGMYYKAKKEGVGRDSENDIQRRGRGDAEMTVDRQLREAMKRFGMAGGADLKNANFKPTSDNVPFSDRKISQLWDKAQKSKMFSEKELGELKEELSDHQEKLDGFHSLMDDVHGPDGSKANSAKRFDNKNPDELREIRNKEMELKLKHRELTREFQKISVKTIPEEERGPFTDNRVITLWREAKSQDFSDDDLAVIMDELKAFEDKIMEHEDTHQEALKSDMTRGPGIKGGRPEQDKNRSLKDRSLFDKAKELGRHVNDRMKELRNRISQGGSWTNEL